MAQMEELKRRALESDGRGEMHRAAIKSKQLDLQH